MNNGFSAGSGRKRQVLDAVDEKIVGELLDDGRLPIAELGRRVNLSSPAVAERMRRLERTGVVTGYRAQVDPRALGYELLAIVRVKPAPRQLPKIPELAAEIPQVVECHRITGEDCFFLKLHLRSMDDLEPLLDRFTPYGRTTTSLIHSSAVDNRALPLTGEPINS